MNVLQLVQRFCQRTGIPSPTAAVASSDPQVTQILALLEEVGEDLVIRHDWQELINEASFVTDATESQGTIASLCPLGMKRIVGETIQNRTLRLPVYGPLTPQKWQALKALPNSGPFYKYRIRGGKLLFNPIPAVGHNCFFEYVSPRVFVKLDTTLSETITADTDEFILDHQLFLAGLRWKWKAEKGLPYAEEFTAYEIAVANAFGANGTKPRISLDADPQGAAHPGIFVTPGNWNLS